MSWLIDFFKGLADVIGAVVDFFLWFLKSIEETLLLAFDALGTCAFYLSQMPVVWLAAFTTIITIAVIFKIKG